VRAAHFRKFQKCKADSDQAPEAHVVLPKQKEEWIMQLQPKDVTCLCGHITSLASRKLMCIKCGKYVFYDEHEKKTHRRQSLYLTAVIVMALGFVTYFFVEMVLGPLKLLLE
jgi:hypothetical protein